MPEKSKFTFRKVHTSSCHYWIPMLIFYSLFMDSLTGAQLHRRALKGAVRAGKTMGVKDEGSLATQVLNNVYFVPDLQPKASTDTEFTKKLNEIRSKFEETPEIDLKQKDKLSEDEVGKVASEMNARQRLLDEATHLTEETLTKQDKYLTEVRLKKDDIYRQLGSTSKEKAPTKNLLKEAEYSHHQSVRDASRSLRLYHTFNWPLKGFWNKLSYFLKRNFAAIRRATWGKNRYAMTLVDSLRGDPLYAVSDIKQKAAVEEIFLTASRRGDFDDFEINLLDRLMKQNTLKNHGLSRSENKNIDGLAESFMLRHLEPEVFTTAKREWIKALRPTSSDIDTEAHLMMLRQSDFNNKAERSRVRNVVNTGQGNRRALREKIANLDKIVNKINNQQVLDPEDRTFLLMNVENRFQPAPFSPESSPYQKRIVGIWDELLPVMKPNKKSEGMVPQPTNVVPIEFSQAAMKKGSTERQEITDAIMGGQPIKDMKFEAYLTSTQLDALEDLQSLVIPLKGNVKAADRAKFVSDIDNILSQAQTPLFKSTPEFLILKREVYQRRLQGILEYLMMEHGKFGKQSRAVNKDVSDIDYWYTGKVQNWGGST